MNFNSLFQLRAARGEGMSALENAASVLFMPDALSYLLTGEKVCEYTILSTSQFMDPRTREIDGLLLREAGVDPALFPRVVMPGRRIGALCDAVARQTGLGAVPWWPSRGTIRLRPWRPYPPGTGASPTSRRGRGR